jgi:hypothetical protein
VAYKEWQAEYSAHGIATFPVEITPERKKPLVKHYGKIGRNGSAQIAERFPNATALGFMGGRKNGITPLDVDSTSERDLADAIGRHGNTPVITKSGSEHAQLWYRYNGEHRRIRVFGDDGPPIDILGDGGFAVGPPSIGRKCPYSFIQGGLDDIDRLPVMRGLDGITAISEAPAAFASPLAGMIEHDGRNDALLHAIGPIARDIYAIEGGSREQLFDCAMKHNQECAQPMDAMEVGRVTDSVWKMTVEGRNIIGMRPGVVLDGALANEIARSDPDLLLMLIFLRANNGPHSEFMITNDGLAKILRWRTTRVSVTRNRLLTGGYVVRTRTARQHKPALYRWDNRAFYRLAIQASPK